MHTYIHSYIHPDIHTHKKKHTHMHICTDASHPYGYATDRYVFSLISGVGIFFLGCGVSTYHGISGLITPHNIEHYEVGLVRVRA